MEGLHEKDINTLLQERQSMSSSKLQEGIVDILTLKYKDMEGVFQEQEGALGGIDFDYDDEARINEEVITKIQMAQLREMGIMRNGLVNSLNDKRIMDTPVLEIGEHIGEASIEDIIDIPEETKFSWKNPFKNFF